MMSYQFATTRPYRSDSRSRSARSPCNSAICSEFSRTRTRLKRKSASSRCWWKSRLTRGEPIHCVNAVPEDSKILSGEERGDREDEEGGAHPTKHVLPQYDAPLVCHLKGFGAQLPPLFQRPVFPPGPPPAREPRAQSAAPRPFVLGF